MHVMQIVKVSLKPSAANTLTKAAHDTVTDWLRQWTPQANFQAVIKPTKEEALDACRETLAAALVPDWLASYGVSYAHFTFEVSHQAVVADKFWMPSSVIWCKDHEIY